MEEQIKDVLRRTFGITEVDRTLSQKTCEKWDSMGQINLVVELEMEFGISLEPEEIADMTTYDEVVRIVSQKIK